MTAIIVPLEIGRRSFPAQIAIDALIIDIEFAGYILGVFVCGVGHCFPRKVKWYARMKRSQRKQFES
jgi:hypothetical protein